MSLRETRRGLFKRSSGGGGGRGINTAKKVGKFVGSVVYDSFDGLRTIHRRKGGGGAGYDDMRRRY